MKSFFAIILVSIVVCAHSQSTYVNYANYTGALTIGDSAKQFTLDSNYTFPAKPVNNPSHPTSLIIPAAFITYGIFALNNNAVRNLDVTTSRTIKSGYTNFKSNVDNYLQYSPALAVYGLNAIGIKGKNNFADRSIMYGLSTIITGGIVCTVKSMSNVKRPDGSASNSFPSGHTTTAFAAAEFLHQEYKHRSPLYSILGYAAATTTGILRMYNNRHYLSDVVAGAGFGMLSTKLVYWVYPVIKRKITGRRSELSQHTSVLP
jgi:membrane-associated phospholipid phosphatase